MTRAVDKEPWREIYHQGLGARFSLYLSLVVLALMLAILAAMVGFGLWLWILNIGRTGGIRPYLGRHGVGTLVVFAIAIYFLRKASILMSPVAGMIQDLRAEPEVWEGKVEDLREERGYRGATVLIMVFHGRRFYVTRKLFGQVRIGEHLRAAVKPNGPTLVRLETRTPAGHA